MTKKLNILFLIISLLFLKNIEINAYNVSSNNNPGSAYFGTEGGGGETTYWPVNQDGLALRAIKIRVFRGNTEIKNAYYSLVEDENKCFSSVQNVTLCETSKYNYSEVSNNAGVTCASNKNVSLGCIKADNLLDTWGVRSAKGEYLDNYLKGGDSPYSNLKEILAGMGYNDTNFNKNDVVIVEPATLVRYKNSDYFGTSTALMKENISYTNGIFINLFKSMSLALKVSASEYYLGDDNYTGFGYFKYKVSDMVYGGNLNIKIIVKNSNPEQLIIGSNATYEIYSGANCNGTLIDIITTTSGLATRAGLSAGTYSIKEKTSPAGYVSSTNKCVKNRISISNNNTTIAKIYYDRTCQSSLNSSDKSINSLLTLYDKYGLNGLLNFSSPSCSNIKCDKKSLDELSCLSGSNKYISNNFNENNLSCFDEKVDANGNIGFCQTTFDLSNNLETDKFYSYSGQFLIKQINYDSPITIYDANLNPINKFTMVSTGLLRKECYIYNNSNYLGYNTLPSAIVSFGDNDSNESADNLRVESNTTQDYIIDVGSFKKHVYEKTNYYKLNPVYLYKISGKFSSIPSIYTTSTPIYGIFTKFNAESGNILFSINYDGKTYSSDSCKFETKRPILDKPHFEFRIIDTKNPFNRNTNSNWSSGTDNSKDNDTVKNYIINRNNSYNSTGAGPKYKIILTSSDIQIIRMYNKENSYDNYEFYCNNNECVSAFLHDLRTGTLNKYQNNSIIKTYGALQNKIEIN